MKKLLFAVFALFVGTALAQVPSSLTAVEQTSTSPTLGSVLNWGAVTGASNYKIYRAPSSCSPSIKNWTLIATTADGVTATYKDSPITKLGAECYYVTAVVNGVEGMPSNQAGDFIGNLVYVTTSVVDNTGKILSQIIGASVEYCDGSTELWTVNTDTAGAVAVWTQLFDGHQYSFMITLPNGQQFNIPAPSSPLVSGIKLSASHTTSNTYYFLLNSDGVTYSVYKYTTYNTQEPTI